MFPRKPRACFLLLCLFFGVLGLAKAQTLKVETDAPPLKVTSGYGVNGLVLWLAADSGIKMDGDDNVSSMADKTGNFTLTAPDADRQPAYVPHALNGKPVLRFNPDQSLYSPEDFGTDLNGDMTMIVLAKTSASRTFFQYPLYLGQNQVSHQNRALAFYNGSQVFDGQWVGFYGPPVVRNAFVVLGVSVNPTLTQATFYQNGVRTTVSGLAREHGDARFENLSNGVTLGAAADPCRGWLGDIAEVLVFDRQLGAPEMQAVWSALSGKYGLQ